MWRSGADYVEQTDFAFARKASNETVNNSASLQDDADLLFAVGANETWIATFVCVYSSTTTADFKTNITSPAGSTTQVSYVGPSAAVSSTAGDVKMAASPNASGSLGGAGAGVLSVLLIYVICRSAGTAGNVVLQWAQNGAEVSDTIMYTDSFVKAQKVA